MNKVELVTKLRDAKRGHKKWVGYALSLIEGVPLEKEQVPLNSTECAFGKWYHGDGQVLMDIPGFKEIDDFHDALHKTYMEIFVLLFGEDQQKKSFWGGLFGRSQKSSEEKRKLAMEKYHTLNNQSKVILDKLEQLEKVIISMSDTQLNRSLRCVSH